MKKAIMHITCLGIIMCLLISSFAISVNAEELSYSTNTIVVSEYDYITDCLSKSESELNALGFADEEIAVFKNFKIEDELLQRQEKTDDVLRNYYGYSNEQIAILREYNGEPIKDNPKLRALFAVLTFSTPTVMRASATEIAVYLTWQWSSKPLWVALTMEDTIAVMWQGTYGSSSGNIRLNTSSSYWLAQYVVESNSFATDSELYSFTTSSPTASAKVTYPTNYGSGFFAMSGSTSLYFETTEGSADLTCFDLLIVYGHSTIVGSASITLQSGFDYTLGIGTEEAAVVSGYINISDKQWRYS